MSAIPPGSTDTMTAPLALVGRANCATTSRVIGIKTASRAGDTYGSGKLPHGLDFAKASKGVKTMHVRMMATAMWRLAEWLMSSNAVAPEIVSGVCVWAPQMRQSLSPVVYLEIQ
jgi:hypothetical protein